MENSKPWSGKSGEIFEYSHRSFKNFHEAPKQPPFISPKHEKESPSLKSFQSFGLIDQQILEASPRFLMQPETGNKVSKLLS